METLREALNYEPQVLRFGTSGRRGEVVHLTQLEIYINALAELTYLQSLPKPEGGIAKGDDFYYAYDLRPSSSRFVPEQGNRGEIAQAIDQAIRDAGMLPVNLGKLPTPALTNYALRAGQGSMMITGSHIPFDRNGYKTNCAKGELLKKDEAPINAMVEQVRSRIYSQPASQSIFAANGNLKSSPRPLPPEIPDARAAYVRRYTDFFAGNPLRGLRLLAYQHSAVGRDILVEILRELGAEVIPAGRSETFVPIDTEAIGASELATIQELAAAAWKGHGPFHAVVSTDGDSDRPLVLSVSPEGASCRVRFYGGDLLGMVVAEFLRADAVVVPISCNDAIDRGALKDKLEPKTRIGSPHVIAAMDGARAKGKQRICGWEANGGFLTGSDFTRDGRMLAALPTRDAMLPILGVLSAAKAGGSTIDDLFARLPRRFSKASLLRKFPRPASAKIMARFSPANGDIAEAFFEAGNVKLLDRRQGPVGDASSAASLEKIREDLSHFFRQADGFGAIARLNYVDGVRVCFGNGDVAHVRPSGNADELRIYAVADTQERADAIAADGVRDPDGILRQMERAVA